MILYNAQRKRMVTCHLSASSIYQHDLLPGNQAENLLMGQWT